MNKKELIYVMRSTFSPNKVVAYAKIERSYQKRDLFVPTLPVVIDIEPNNWCNYKCEHCQVTHWNKKKSKLSLDNFKKIIDQFPNLSKVKLQGMSEPFLYDQTIEMLEELERRKIATTTTSNGQIISKDLLERLSKLTNCKIHFSIDGGNKEVFEKIRIGGNFDIVTKNISDLISKNPKANVVLWSVITNENLDNYEEIILLTKKIGVKYLVFQPFLSDWGDNQIKEIVENKKIYKDKIDKLALNSKKIAKKLGINLTIFKDNFMTKKNPCFLLWKTMYIDASGNVIPCSAIGNSDVLNFGNIFEQNINDIWNNHQYMEFRRMHRDFEIPDICKMCYKHDNI